MIQENITPTAEQIAKIKENAYNALHPDAWIWDEEKVSWVAPINPPSDGKPYLWDNTTHNWVSFYPPSPPVWDAESNSWTYP